MSHVSWCLFLVPLLGSILNINSQILLVPLKNPTPQINDPNIGVFSSGLLPFQFVSPVLNLSEPVIEEDDYDDYDDYQDDSSKPFVFENAGKGEEFWFDDDGNEDNIKDGLLTQSDIRKDEAQNFANSNYSFYDPSSRYRCPKCACGIRFRNRIVGGVFTKKLEFPWMVMVELNKRFYCGGTIIADRIVLTARHCTYKKTVKQLTVRVREYNRLQPHETYVFRMSVAQIIGRLDYNPRTLNNDLSLLRLRRRLTFSGGIRPICLPDDGQSYEGKNAIVAGWGSISENGPSPGPLKKVIVPIVTNTRCRNTLDGRQVTKKMLCAGYVKTGGRDHCFGDSGGPLMVISSRKFRLAGVVSWAIGCAQPNAPGVYARANQFLKWIRKNTKGSCYCK